MTRARRLSLLVVTLCGFVISPLSAQSRWTEHRGESFVLQSQISADGLSKVACDLTTAAHILRPAQSTSSEPTSDALKVVAVDSAKGMREWVPQPKTGRQENTLGAYWHGLFGDHIVVRVDASPAERLRRVLHEYAHYVTHASNPEPPRWLDEGTSEIWEHATTKPGSIAIGAAVKEHLKVLRSGKNWIPVRDLVAANEIPTRSDDATKAFYAESWALVHYLMFRQGPGTQILRHMPAAAEMPTDAELKAYVAGRLGPALEISTRSSGQCEPAAGRVMTPFESSLGRAQALADSDRADSALPPLREALALDPDSVAALETLGFVHFAGNRPSEAAAIFDQVIARGTASFISYYYRAVLAGPIPERKDEGGRVSEVEYLRKALALNPRFGPAVQRLRELTGKH